MRLLIEKLRKEWKYLDMVDRPTPGCIAALGRLQDAKPKPRQDNLGWDDYLEALEKLSENETREAIQKGLRRKNP